MMVTRPMRWALLALLALVVSCGTEDLTQLMVVVDTDFQVPEEIDELVVTVRDTNGQEVTADGPITEETLPLRLAVVHRGGPLGPLTVKAEGWTELDDGRRGPLIQRRAVVYFVEGEVRELRMDLLRECLGMSCGGDQTCAEGGCRSRTVEEDELGRYDGPRRTDFGMPDMGPADMDVDACVPVEEVCDEVDNDCDGRVDEDFDLDNDMQNCGACDNACEVDPVRGSEICTARECVLICDDGFADCNDDPSDGCEASLTSAATCGSCEQSCSGATPVCDLDTCVADCPVGTTLCTDTCADLDSAVRNCGTCDNECAGATNASPLCTEGSCRLRCDTGFFNCDMMAGNGCESRLRELANCGTCGVRCEAAGATTSCATGTCQLVSCNGTLQDCDGDLMNGCEADVANDPNTCGSCDNVCPADPANAVSTCVMGSCALACDPGYDDCNLDPSDGCETFLGAVDNCGACGILCDGATDKCSGSTATGFACTGDCGAGEKLCGESCVDTSTDVRNCGDCDILCTDPPRASPTCSSGSCGFACDTGFANCDGDAGNGCEANLSSTSSCNSCGNVCNPVPNGTVACQSSGCVIATCSGSFRHCDTDYANGCETDVSSSVDNCGGCGVTCVPGMRVANVGCDAGSCVIEACEAGFADCDGDFATGCEQRLGTRNNCSACDDRCTGGGMNRCCDGVCGSC